MKRIAFILSIMNSISFLSAQNTYVDLFGGTKTIVLDGIFKDLNLNAGVAKTAVPVSLPANARGFYYRITVLPKRSNTTQHTDLLNTVRQISGDTTDVPISNKLTAVKSGRKANFYFMKGRANANGLENYNHFKYFKKFLHHKSFYGYLENTGLDELYIGIENGYELRGVKILLEVVAVI